MIGNRLSSWYEQFSDYMERDTKGVEIGIYTVSGVLFAVACYKIRPITKFSKPSDIPNRFIKDQVLQYGNVSSIESAITGPLLKINHRPPLNIFFSSKKRLPVKIAGVQINSNGYSWLQTVTVNREVTFLPLSKENNHVECQVFLHNSSPQKPILDLAECLTILGFANVNNNLGENKNLQKYYDNLIKLQNRAKKTRTGLWAEKIPPPVWPINSIQKYVSKVILSILPQNKRLPELVR
ncbi:Protein C3orf33 like [Pseudolycoriella hygida]|uniref:Protein C3orf33 like n=1 Tax=Pseudolycoriella hygida TaxID=35572 RepID=A0A9Q0MSQ6_9DIPT|nr:Protein C3orf33 like [Pseudolycoriella hygida]